MDYTPTEINRLAESTWGMAGKLMPFGGYDAGQVYIYRFMLQGGPPSSASPSVHLSLAKALAEVPLVDCDEYQVLGISLLPIDSGTPISGWDSGTHYQAQDPTFVADIVFKSMTSNSFWFNKEAWEQKARAALAQWGGGYATAATVIGLAGPGSPLELQTAMGFWSQQPAMFYANAGAVTPQRSGYTDKVNSGTLGVGLSFGLSDFPGRLVPMKWGTSVTQPGTPGTQPGQPGMPTPTIPKPPDTKRADANGQNWLVMAACAVAGYAVFKNFTEKR